MWELDHKKAWTLKNWCFWTMLKNTLESPLVFKEIKPVSPKGNQFCIFTGRTDAEAETPILWLSDAKSWLIRKDTNAGKDWRQEEKGTTEDNMVRWHHLLNGYEFEQAPGDGEGQGILVCLSPWCRKESDTSSDWATGSVPNYHSISVFHLETILFFLTKYERMVGMSAGIQVLKVITT